jgi:hypothetical protein
MQTKQTITFYGNNESIHIPEDPYENDLSIMNAAPQSEA